MPYLVKHFNLRFSLYSAYVCVCVCTNVCAVYNYNYTLLGPCILGNRGGITRIFSCFCPLRIQKQGKYQ